MLQIVDKLFCTITPDINTRLSNQSREDGIGLLSQVRNLFRVRSATDSFSHMVASSALIDDLYADRPALVLFLPDKHPHKIAGHPKTSKLQAYKSYYQHFIKLGFKE